MREIEKRARLTRRRFLKTSGAAAVGVGALQAGMVLIDPRGAWAMALTTLPPDVARNLVQMARDLYPHDKLAESFYAKAIEPYDAAAGKDPALKDLLVKGSTELDRLSVDAGAKSYADIADEGKRVAILKTIAATPFFAKIRGDMITGLYNQPEVWPLLGYEGPSAPKGGYIHRGFNDIDWLKA